MATTAELTPLRVKNLTLVLRAIMAIKYCRYCKLKTDGWDRLGMSVLSVPIFPTALKRTITTKGVFLHVSTEEEGLNESWHGFICTAHIINISEKKKLHWANIQITKKSVQVQAMICRWWQQCYIIIWTYSLCSCCINLFCCQSQCKGHTVHTLTVIL